MDERLSIPPALYSYVWADFLCRAGGVAVMLQRLLTKYGLAFHVACVCLFPFLFLSHPRAFNDVPLLWLSLLVAEMLVCLPSVKRYETLSDARARVYRALLWDPFFYVGLGIVGVAAVRLVNSGCELVYLPDADIWQMSAPPVDWAPFSVGRTAALANLSFLAACVAVGVALRVALGKASKRWLLQTLSCASGCVAVCLVVQNSLSAPSSLELVDGAMHSAWGTLFGLWLLLGIGLLTDAMARGQRGKSALFLLGVAGNLAGLLFFAHAVMAAVFSVLALLLLLHGLAYLRSIVPRGDQFKLFLGYVLLVVLAVLACVFVFPENPLAVRVKAALSDDSGWESWVASRKLRSNAALKIWQEHPWSGVGPDGFGHYVGFSVESKEWGGLKMDRAYVYHDWLQYLCETGVLGVMLFLAAGIILLVPVCYRARLVWRYGSQDENEGRSFLFRLSPVVVTGTVATGACFVESWFGSPFQSPAILMTWLTVMAALPAFMPTPKAVAH